MNLSSCLHPKIVRNRFTGEKMQVPCGHCDQCKNLRSYMWSQKICDEMSLHKYNIFFTLTYDDDNVPMLVKQSRFRLVSLFRDRMHLLSDNKYHSFSVDDSISIDLHPYLANCSDFDSKYYRSRKLFPYCRIDDVRNFLKRLRSKIDYYFPNENSESKKVYSFIASEYGGKTFRPHYHGVLMFDSQWIAENFESLISQSWLFGNRDWSYVSRQDRCASYVAKYCVKPSDCPCLYSDSEISSFYTFSRSLSFGFGVLSDDKIFEILSDASPTVARYSRKDECFVDVPLYQSYENRIFPRLRRFDSLSDSSRIILYGLWKDLCFPRFERFKGCITYLVLGRNSPFECQESFRRSLLGYYNTNFHDPVLFKLNFSNEVLKFFRECVSLDMQAYGRGDSSFNCLRSLYYCSRKVCLWCINHGYSLPWYVKQIFNYYVNKESYKLKNQLEFESSYSAEHDPSDLIWLYPAQVDDLTNSVTIPQESFDSFFSHEYFKFKPLQTTFGWKITSINSEELMKKSQKKSVVRDSFDYSRFITTISHFEII